MHSLLIVDDEEDIVELFRDFLEDEDVEIFSAHNGEEAIAQFKKNPCDFVLTDIMMPGELDGLEVILELKDMNPDLMIFAMTGDADPGEEMGYLDAAEMFGAEEVFQKPLMPQKVLDKIHELKPS